MFVRLPRPLRAATVLATAVALSGCGPSSEVDNLEGREGPLSGPFYVSDYFSPSGHMGDGQFPGFITALIGEDGLKVRRQWCADQAAAGLPIADGCPERPPGAGGDAYTFIYKPAELLWAGVYWVYPTNSWGSRPGRVLAPEPRYTKVRFWVATDTPGMPGQFIIGGITDPLLEYQDKFRRSIFVSALTQEYTYYEIPIPAQSNISTVIGGFCWVTNYPANTDPSTAKPVAIFIDDVVWE